MTEFSCEFCKAEFKDNSRLQRHIKTSKKCISKRTPKRDETRDPLISSDLNTKSVQVEETDLMAKYTQALKKIEEKEEELRFKEATISILNDRLNSKERCRGGCGGNKDISYYVDMYCMCGMLAIIDELKMKGILDETLDEKFEVEPNKFERKIIITIYKNDIKMK